MIASNVMTTYIQTLNEDATVRDAISILEHSGLNDIPVINQHSQAIGIVTAKSILHHAIPSYATNSLLSTMKAGPDIDSVYKNIEHVLDHSIQEVTDKNFQTVKPSTATSAVAAMLATLSGDTHNVLVVDDQNNNQLIGIISARDILIRQTHIEP